MEEQKSLEWVGALLQAVCYCGRGDEDEDL